MAGDGQHVDDATAYVFRRDLILEQLPHGGRAARDALDQLLGIAGKPKATNVDAIAQPQRRSPHPGERLFEKIAHLAVNADASPQCTQGVDAYAIGHTLEGIVERRVLPAGGEREREQPGHAFEQLQQQGALQRLAIDQARADEGIAQQAATIQYVDQLIVGDDPRAHHDVTEPSVAVGHQHPANKAAIELEQMRSVV